MDPNVDPADPQGTWRIVTEIPTSDFKDRDGQALARLAIQLVEADTMEKLVRVLAATTEDWFHWDAFSLVEHISGTDLYRRVHAVDRIEGRQVVLPSEEKPRGYKFIEGETVTNGDALLINRSDFEREHATAERFGDLSRASASLMFVPMIADSDAIAILSVQSYTQNRYDSPDLERLRSLAELAAPALRRLHLEREARECQDLYRQAITQADAVPYRRDYKTSALTFLGEGIDRLTGYPVEEVTPEKLHAMIQDIVLHGEVAGLTPMEAHRRSRSGETRSYRADYRIVAADGTFRWLADSSIAVFNSQGVPTGSIGILQDITDRMATDALNHVLSRLGRELGAATTPHDVGLVTVQAAAEIIRWDACFLNLYNESKRTVDCILCIDTVDGERREFPVNYQRDIPPSSMFFRTLRDGKQLHLRETGRRRTDNARSLWGDETRRSESLMFVPIREKGERSVGVLSLQSYTPRAYTEKDLETLQILADYCGSALERARAEQKLRVSERRAAAFASLAARLNSASSALEAGRIIADTSLEILGWDCCNLDLYSDEEDLTYDILNIDTVDGNRVEYEIARGAKTTTALGRRLLREGAFLILRSPRELEEAALKSDTVRFGNTSRLSASLMFVPSRKGDRVVGIVSIQSYSHNAYTAEDLETLQILADHCGGALERIQVENRLALERRRIDVFAELGRKLSAARTPREAGEIIVAAARKLIGWDSCFLILYSEEKDCVFPVFIVDRINGKIQEVPHDRFIGRPRGYTEQTIREGSQLVLRSKGPGAHSPGVPFGDVERQSLSLMYVPINRDTHVIGVLSIQSYRPNAYTRSDLELLESLGQHCSGALERIQAEEALRESEERYALAARGANDGLWDWNLATGVVHYSPRLQEMIGCGDDEVGNRIDDWMDRVHPEDLAGLEESLRDHLEGRTGHFESEHRLRHKDGTYRWCLFRGAAVRDDSGTAVRLAGSMTDIAERRATQDQLVHAAFHDPLTGLPNRALFVDRLERCFLRHRRKPDFHFAVFFLDLDGFKRVNDSLGHIIGDRLLVKVANRLVECVREGDTVARMGGDEFTILLEDMNDTAEAERVAERLLRELSEPVILDGIEVQSAASIGVALGHPGYGRIDDILRDADAALYRAKERGKGIYVLHDPDSNEARPIDDAHAPDTSVPQA